MRTELKRVSDEADQTYRLYLDRGLDVPQFKERYQPLDARKKELEAELPKIEAEVDALKINSISAAEVMQRAQDLPARWQKMTSEERRQLIEIVVKENLVGEKEFDVTLYELPIFKEVTNKQRMLLYASRSPGTTLPESRSSGQVLPLYP
jgi:site-specific DNA recombinase